MASVESTVSELEADYNQILEAFGKFYAITEKGGYFSMAETELLKILRITMKFQRRIEMKAAITGQELMKKLKGSETNRDQIIEAVKLYGSFLLGG